MFLLNHLSTLSYLSLTNQLTVEQGLVAYKNLREQNLVLEINWAPSLGARLSLVPFNIDIQLQFLLHSFYSQENTPPSFDFFSYLLLYNSCTWREGRIHRAIYICAYNLS
jgi:hypothetical protein